MALPREFLSYNNFELAFLRIVRGSNKVYKQFYRYSFQSYNLALEQNLKDLIQDVKTGVYEASKTTVVFQPKKSGVLRPLTLLAFRDLIVYQALVNIIATKFESVQKQYALKKSFGNFYAGRSSLFFYRSWKNCLRAYNTAITEAFEAENVYVADFDLVSFYELIDHSRLRNCLKKKVKNPELLDLLFKCLESWTMKSAGAHLRHGVPQGPEASAFLAECFLFHFDAKSYDVTYLRYVDDIKLMAKAETSARRALLRLDLASKELGLVPQAQKIQLSKVNSLEEIQKMIPSQAASAREIISDDTLSQKNLIRMLRESIRQEGEQCIIEDTSKFKFSLLRLNPRRTILKLIAPMLDIRPDCSWVFAAYLKKFPKDKAAADILLEALKMDPIYDYSAANYIEAMDICEPDNSNCYRQAIRTARHRSEEKSILLPISCSIFHGRRCGPEKAIKLIDKQKHPLVKGILLHRLFGDAPDAPYKISDCKSLLERTVNGDDADLAQFCASLLLGELPWPWHPTKSAHRSVKLLMLALGLRSRAPSKPGILDTFFEKKMKIFVPILWRKALGRGWQDAERRCLRLQKFLVGDPTARVMMLDTFNEALIQAFSKKHSCLSAAYAKAANKGLHPNIGNWLDNPALSAVLPKGICWFKEVHNTRVGADMAHAKQSKRNKGAATKAVPYDKADSLMKKAQVAWAELINEWNRIL